MYTDPIKSLYLQDKGPVHLRKGLGRVYWSTPPGDAVQEGVVYGGVVAAVAKHAPLPLGQLLLKQTTRLNNNYQTKLVKYSILFFSKTNRPLPSYPKETTTKPSRSAALRWIG